MSDQNQIPSVPLTGRELINKIRELNRLPGQEIVKQCGYYTVTSSGEEKINVVDYYNAVLTATKDITIRSELNSDIEKHFTRPWPERRGIEHTDRNAFILLARVPIEELSKAVADLAIESQTDVIKAEIKVSYRGSFAFQIVGQNWSIVTTNYLQQSDIEKLSKQFQQPFIELGTSDTCGSTHYQLYDSGELIEIFDGYEGACIEDPENLDPRTQKYELYPYPEGTEATQTAYFWSSRRQVTAEEIYNIWDFPDRLLIEFEAYDPAINSDYFLAGYHRFGSEAKPLTWRVQNPGHSMVMDGNRTITTIPEFVRVDYFIFK